MPSDAEIEDRYFELLSTWYTGKVGRDLSEAYAVYNSCRPSKAFCKGPHSVRAGEFLTQNRKNRCNNVLCPACMTWRLGTLLRNVIVSNHVYFAFKQLGWLGGTQVTTQAMIVDWEERNQGRIPGEYHGWVAVMEQSQEYDTAEGYTRVGLWSTEIDPSLTPLRHRLGFLETHWYDKPSVGLWYRVFHAQDIESRFGIVEDILDSIDPLESGLTSGELSVEEYTQIVTDHARESYFGKASRF